MIMQQVKLWEGTTWKRAHYLQAPLSHVNRGTLDRETARRTEHNSGSALCALTHFVEISDKIPVFGRPGGRRASNTSTVVIPGSILYELGTHYR